MKAFFAAVFSILLLFPLAYSQEGKYYEVSLNYTKNEIILNSINVKAGFANGLPSFGTFRYEIIDFSNKSISSNNVDIVNGSVVLKIPYKNEGQFILIYKDFKKAAQIDVARFANLCGNKICEYIENYGSCSKDCQSGKKDSYCDGVVDGICDPDCKGDFVDKDCSGSAINLPLFPILIIGLVIVAGIAIYFVKRKSVK